MVQMQEYQRHECGEIEKMHSDVRYIRLLEWRSGRANEMFSGRRLHPAHNLYWNPNALPGFDLEHKGMGLWIC